jgi:hypothetical protein
MKTLDDLVRIERNRIHAFIDAKKEFLYLSLMNSTHFDGAFDIGKVYDFALDSYSYWKRNGVVNAKEESLVTTFKVLYNKYEEYLEGLKR